MNQLSVLLLLVLECGIVTPAITHKNEKRDKLCVVHVVMLKNKIGTSAALIPVVKISLSSLKKVVEDRAFFVGTRVKEEKNKLRAVL